jgi:alanyl-tRNA synthetase
MPESDYALEFFQKQGFARQTCSACGTPFWSLGAHATCGEAPCQEYDFIGSPPFKKKLTYRAMREDFLSFLEQNGHARVRRYPIVARWRDDVFFTQASIYPFQPWVIDGVASPPANPLGISQPCVRFTDIDNVGKTGQHFTMFEMMAHHAFNFSGRPVYYKERTVELCHAFLTERLGLDPATVRYKESWWQGGGNSGPCFEVTFGGAEAATLVFMENRETAQGRERMDTTVVDTGYGLERLTWLSQGTTSAYEAVFGDALAYLKRATGAKQVDERVLREYSKVAGNMKVESLGDLRAIREATAARLGMTPEDLEQEVAPLEALYTICDHARALVFVLGDGVVPSNGREGYFARLLVRRGLRALKGLNIAYTLADTVSFLVDQMREDYPEFFFNKADILKLLKVEEARYRETLEKGRAIVGRLEADLAAAGKAFDADALIELYDSHGLSPEVVQGFTSARIAVPDDFFQRVAARHERPETTEGAVAAEGLGDLPATRLRVYEDKRKRRFRAKVLALHGDALILDQTFFYPEGGGQEADHGTIGGHDVVDVRKVGPTVLHRVRGDAGALVGTRVTCEIDDARRRALTLHHTATHIVLGAARKVLGNHVWQTGAHKAPDLARLDITHYDALTDEELSKIEAAANEQILRGAAVRARFLPRDLAERKFGTRLYQGGSVPGGELRVVEIPTWDVEACGGTHASRTSEVGLIRILRSSRIQDGVVRLEYAAGRPALEAVFAEAQALRAVADVLGAPRDQLVPAAERLVAEARDLRKRVQRAEDAQASDAAHRAVAADAGAWPLLKQEVREGVRFMMSMSKATAAEPRATGIFWASSPSDVKLVVTRGAKVPLDAAELIGQVAPEFRGKGGGRPDFAEASFPSATLARGAADRLERLVRERLAPASG